MLSRLKIFLSFLILFSLNAFGFAQEGQKSAADKAQTSKKTKMGKEEKTLTPQQQRALFIIDQLSDVAKKLDNQQSRIRIRSQIADLLWKYDESQARILFEEVFNEANSAFSELIKERKGQIAPSPTGVPQLQQLTNVLSLIARRDKNWADKLLKSVTEFKFSGGIYNSQSFLPLQIAASLAETSPEIASQIAISSLSNGINPMIGGILHQLQHSNPQLAETLFVNALNIIRRDPANAFINIRVLSTYVFPSTEEDSLDSVLGRSRETSPVNTTLIQQFLNFAYSTIMQSSGSQPSEAIDPMYAQYKPAFDYQTMYKLLPFFDQYMPDKSRMIRSQLNEIGRQLPGERLDSLTNSNIQGRIQDLLSKADSAPLAMKDSLYIQAAMLASRNGQTERALSIADSISKERRTDILSVIHYQAAMRAMGKEDFDSAYRYAQNITIEGQCSLVFSQLAEAMRKQKLSQRAIEVLNDAEQLISKFENGPNRAHALLEIENAMVKLDTNRAFEVMRSVVKAINQAEFGIDNTVNSGRIILGLSAINFDLSFAKLAAQDFDRTHLIAQLIEMKDASFLAQLAACRGVLINLEMGVPKFTKKKQINIQK